MIGMNWLGIRGRMLALLAGVVTLGAGRGVLADLPLPHTATVNSSNALLRLTNTNGGSSAFGFWGTGTYGFVGESTVSGGAGVRGSFFDATTGAPRASGNLGRSAIDTLERSAMGGGSPIYYGVWGKLFPGSDGAAVFGLSDSETASAGVFQIKNASGRAAALLALTNGPGPAVYGVSSSGTSLGRLAAAGFFETINSNRMDPCLKARHTGQGDAVQGEHAGSIGTAGTFIITNNQNPSVAMFAHSLGSGLACLCASDSLVDGDLEVTGGLTPSAAAIKIDHPLDPGNRYLQLPAVHSSEMTNILKGMIVLDQNGEALVELPEWFEAANGDFTYHLTPVGAPAPGLYVAQEIENNTFQIAGGPAGLKVSWLVTGIRQDPYAVQNPIAVEADKPAGEVGRYRHPEAYGLPEDYRLRYDERAGEYRAESTDEAGVVGAVETEARAED